MHKTILAASIAALPLAAAAQTDANRPATELIVNGGFESGQLGWQGPPPSGAGQGPVPYKGEQFMWLGGWGSVKEEVLSQSVTIPADAASATLSFALNVSTSEAPAKANDTMTVSVRDGALLSRLATYSNLDAAAGYQVRSIDLGAYRGKTVQIVFQMLENASLATAFLVDEVSLKTTTAAPTQKLAVAGVMAAQTHVIPLGGQRWNLPKGPNELHLVGGRDALVMLYLDKATPVRPVLEGWLNSTKLGEVPVRTPAQLPPTEAGGPAYATDLYSATVPRDWMKRGLELRVRGDNYAASDPIVPEIGMDSTLNIRLLPFYLFGAEQLAPLGATQATAPPAKVAESYFARMPVSSINWRPADTKVVWPYLVIAPADGKPARRISASDPDNQNHFILDSLRALLIDMRAANGERNSDYAYYAPTFLRTADGKAAFNNGGMGGGSAGAGDADISGVFIHEMGHAFGLLHAANPAFLMGDYPDAKGNLRSSAWGYDAPRAEFVPTFMAELAPNYASKCLTGKREKGSDGRCIKQDVMEGGNNDQLPDQVFTLFSDYNAGLIQRYFEGKTRDDGKGGHSFDGGVVSFDPNSATQYSRWDSIDQKRVPVARSTKSEGAYGLDGFLPQQRDVPVHTIIITYSMAGTAEASQIYPPISQRGNLLRSIDPTSPSDLEQIGPSGPLSAYCYFGCEHTIKVVYADGSAVHVLMQTQSLSKPASAQNPLDGRSFKQIVVNVPGDKPIRSIEFLETPEGGKGLLGAPKVLLGKTL